MYANFRIISNKLGNEFGGSNFRGHRRWPLHPAQNLVKQISITIIVFLKMTSFAIPILSDLMSSESGPDFYCTWNESLLPRPFSETRVTHGAVLSKVCVMQSRVMLPLAV